MRISDWSPDVCSSDLVGEIVNGLVKRHEFGNVIVDLGRAEAVLRKDEMLPREHYRRNDRVRAVIFDVREEVRGPPIFLTRAQPTALDRTRVGSGKSVAFRADRVGRRIITTKKTYDALSLAKSHRLK